MLSTANALSLKGAIISKAPGKVLISGGYGVLESGNIGLSLALENYFYSVLKYEVQEDIPQQLQIRVRSPQIQETWLYIYHPKSYVLQEIKNKVNPFVQNAIRFSLKYLIAKKSQNHIKSIEITILFDRGFLSEENTIQKQQKFINYGGKFTKTGLGSSACVTVCIVRALCKLFNENTDNTVNCLSQISNLAAQNKIGSNFDISTAVFGSHLYKNILPQKAYEVMINNNFQDILSIDPQIKKISPVNTTILNSSHSFIIDVKKGANTRSMVTGFLKKLDLLDPQIRKSFFERSKQISQILYEAITSNLANEVQSIQKFKKINEKHRILQQEYSKLTQTTIQPQQFKNALDCICSLPFVYYAICPGSGGYDAIFVLTSATNSSLSHTKSSLAEAMHKEGWICEVKSVNISWQEQNEITQDESVSISRYFDVYS